MNELPVSSAFDISAVETIAPDGSWEDVAFAHGCLQTPLYPAQPKVFRVARR